MPTPWTPIEIDASIGRMDGARARVPEGYYLVECEGLDPTAEEYEKTPGIFNKVRIIQGPASAPGVGVGGRMRDYNVIGKKDAFFAIGQTLKAFGLEAIGRQMEARAKAGQPLKLNSYADFANFTSSLEKHMLGKRAVALIADQPGNNGRPFSGVESLSPESEWDTLRQAQVVGTPSAPQATATVNGTQATASTGAADLFADLDSAL